jgi:hypothetical protein
MEEASSVAAVGIAQCLIQARTGYSPEAAVTALSTAAHGHAMTVYEMAEVMIADRDIRSGEPDRA